MTGNVRQAVPFFNVSDMQASLAFYVDGLGFRMTQRWDPDGSIRWCWLQKDEVGIMLQGDGSPVQGASGLSVMFMCEDALAIYRDAKARGLEVSPPIVGNGMWVTSFTDPDGYSVEFESATDVAEETEYDEGVH